MRKKLSVDINYKIRYKEQKKKNYNVIKIKTYILSTIIFWRSW